MANVVRTKPGGEYRAESNLAAQGFPVFLPLGRECGSVFPYFRGYLFVWAGAGWSRVRNTRGVADLLFSGGVPGEVSDDLIEDLRGRMVDGAIELGRPRVERFSVGDRVRINEGAYAGLWGIYQRSQGDRIVALLNMFGRPVRATVPEAFVA